MEVNNNQAPNFNLPQPNFEFREPLRPAGEIAPGQPEKAAYQPIPQPDTSGVSLPPFVAPQQALPTLQVTPAPQNAVVAGQPAEHEDELTKRAVTQAQSVVQKTSSDPYQESELIKHIKTGFISQRFSVAIKNTEDL